MTRWWKVSAGRLQPGHPSLAPRVWEPAPESHGSVDRTEHMVALVPEERVGTGLGPAAPSAAPRLLRVPPRPAPRWPGEEVV